MNMQSFDDHVSFYASHLALSPCGKMLLVSTEGPRLVIYRVRGDRWTTYLGIHVTVVPLYSILFSKYHKVRRLDIIIIYYNNNLQ